MEPDIATYTAKQISHAWGMTRQAVQYHLADVAPDRRVMVRGIEAGAWSYDRLPEALRKKGKREALERPAKKSPPAIPLSELHPDCIEQATKLQRALRPVLERRNDPEPSQAQRAEWGLKLYAKEFGHGISSRHWWKLYDRTIDRDDGNSNWASLEIYLPNQVKGKVTTGTALADRDEDFRVLHRTISEFKAPGNPTTLEKSALWDKAFELFDSEIKTGSQAKQLRLRLLAFLWRHCPSLAKSPNALRVAFDARRSRKSQIDGRTEKRGVPKAPPLDQENVQLIAYYSATYTGGRDAQAARELNAGGLITDPRIKKSLDCATSKSHLLQAVRDEAIITRGEANRVCVLGSRAIRKMVPPRELTYEGIYAMDCLVGDDETANCYVAVPNAEGWFDVIRPQLIPVIDFRSMRVLSRAVIPRPQYTAADVRASFKQAMMRYGLTKSILREGGIWRKSNLVNSLAFMGTGLPANAPFSPAETEYLLKARKGIRVCGSMEELIASLGNAGIQFRESYQARSKPVEGVIRLLQTHSGKLDCYCGRDEKIDCPQSTKEAVEAVRSRKARPEDVKMLCFSAFVREYHAICDRYNADRQDEGRKLRHPVTGAPLSPDEAFKVFENANDPPVGFDAETAMILAAVKLECEVKAPRIRRRQFPCGFVEIMGNTYCSEETGRRIGQKLIAYYDPEFPETCAFTDSKTPFQPFVVPRLEPTNALHIDEQTSLSTAQARRTISVVQADYRAMEARFEPLLRRTILSRETVELSQQVKQQREEITAKQKQHQKEVQRARRLAADTGIVQPSHTIDGADPDAGKELRRFLKKPAAGTETPAEPRDGKTYFIKSASTPQRAYVDYLLKRLTDFRAAGKSYGQQFAGEVSIHSTARIARKALDCDLYDPARFEDVCQHLKSKIDATIQGKTNHANDRPNYHAFEQEAAP